MNPASAGEHCPVDLDYPEPHPAGLDPVPIMRRGRRLRQRRRIAAAGLALASCAAAASIVVGARSGTWFPPPATAARPAAAAPIDAQVAATPPVTGVLTLLSRWPAHWTTVAWATRGGAVCWATFRTPMQGGSSQYECPGWPSGQIPAPASQAMSPLLPGIFPEAPGRSRLVPEVGLVTPRAVRVQVSFFGHAFSAAVVPVPLGGGRTVGVYFIWMRLPPGVSGYGSPDIGPATAYDAAGRVVARHGTGM
jgi:hypothetical protein